MPSSMSILWYVSPKKKIDGCPKRLSANTPSGSLGRETEPKRVNVGRSSSEQDFIGTGPGTPVKQEEAETIPKEVVDAYYVYMNAEQYYNKQSFQSRCNNTNSRRRDRPCFGKTESTSSIGGDLYTSSGVGSVEANSPRVRRPKTPTSATTSFAATPKKEVVVNRNSYAVHLGAREILPFALNLTPPSTDVKYRSPDNIVRGTKFTGTVPLDVQCKDVKSQSPWRTDQNAIADAQKGSAGFNSPRGINLFQKISSTLHRQRDSLVGTAAVVPSTAVASEEHLKTSLLGKKSTLTCERATSLSDKSDSVMRVISPSGATFYREFRLPLSPFMEASVGAAMPVVQSSHVQDHLALTIPHSRDCVSREQQQPSAVPQYCCPPLLVDRGGFINIGNSCYLGSVLSVLLRQPLFYYLITQFSTKFNNARLMERQLLNRVYVKKFIPVVISRNKSEKKHFLSRDQLYEVTSNSNNDHNNCISANNNNGSGATTSGRDIYSRLYLQDDSSDLLLNRELSKFTEGNESGGLGTFSPVLTSFSLGNGVSGGEDGRKGRDGSGSASYSEFIKKISFSGSSDSEFLESDNNSEDFFRKTNRSYGLDIAEDELNRSIRAGDKKSFFKDYNRNEDAFISQEQQEKVIVEVSTFMYKDTNQSAIPLHLQLAALAGAVWKLARHDDIVNAENAKLFEECALSCNLTSDGACEQHGSLPTLSSLESTAFSQFPSKRAQGIDSTDKTYMTPKHHPDPSSCTTRQQQLGSPYLMDNQNIYPRLCEPTAITPSYLTAIDAAKGILKVPTVFDEGVISPEQLLDPNGKSSSLSRFDSFRDWDLLDQLRAEKSIEEPICFEHGPDPHHESWVYDARKYPCGISPQILQEAVRVCCLRTRLPSNPVGGLMNMCPQGYSMTKPVDSPLLSCGFLGDSSEQHDAHELFVMLISILEAEAIEAERWWQFTYRPAKGIERQERVVSEEEVAWLMDNSKKNSGAGGAVQIMDEATFRKIEGVAGGQEGKNFLYADHKRSITSIVRDKNFINNIWINSLFKGYLRHVYECRNLRCGDRRDDLNAGDDGCMSSSSQRDDQCVSKPCGHHVVVKDPYMFISLLLGSNKRVDDSSTGCRSDKHHSLQKENDNNVAYDVLPEVTPVIANDISSPRAHIPLYSLLRKYILGGSKVDDFKCEACGDTTHQYNYNIFTVPMPLLMTIQLQRLTGSVSVTPRETLVSTGHPRDRESSPFAFRKITDEVEIPLNLIIKAQRYDFEVGTCVEKHEDLSSTGESSSSFPHLSSASSFLHFYVLHGWINHLGYDQIGGHYKAIVNRTKLRDKIQRKYEPSPFLEQYAADYFGDSNSAIYNNNRGSKSAFSSSSSTLKSNSLMRRLFSYFLLNSVNEVHARLQKMDFLHVPGSSDGNHHHNRTGTNNTQQQQQESIDRHSVQHPSHCLDQGGVWGKRGGFRLYNDTSVSRITNIPPLLDRKSFKEFVERVGREDRDLAEMRQVGMSSLLNKNLDLLVGKMGRRATSKMGSQHPQQQLSLKKNNMSDRSSMPYPKDWLNLEKDGYLLFYSLVAILPCR